MAQNKSLVSAARFALTFAAVYLVSTFAMQYLFPGRFNSAENGAEARPALVLTPTRLKAPLGRNITLKIQNTTEKEISLPAACPNPPLLIEKSEGENFTPVDSGLPVVPCTPLPSVPARAEITVDLSPWKYEAFGEIGTYRVSVPESSNENISESEIIVREPNLFVRIFRVFISKPLLNAMVLLAAILPGHNLGLSIIFLTILVKLLLYLPSKHAMESQRKLQRLQPKLDEIKTRYSGDQAKITEETMKLWREEKINPLQSCLPTVLQIPVLLGLFFIIRDSGALPLARHLLYTPFSNLDWTFGASFLGMDLTRVPFQDLTWSISLGSLLSHLRAAPVPLLTALLQGAQMKLAFAASKKKKAATVAGGDALAHL
ncbi:MAG: YidC/Oxa1 family membrane protein insertase, partial [Patescibacteria group bacterium]